MGLEKLPAGLWAVDHEIRERESQHTRPARLKVKVGEKNLKQTREKRRRRKKKVYSKCRLLLCTSSTLRKDKGNLSLMTAGMPSISGQTTIFDSFDTGPDPKRQSLKPFSPVHLLLLFFFCRDFLFYILRVPHNTVRRAVAFKRFWRRKEIQRCSGAR